MYKGPRHVVGKGVQDKCISLYCNIVNNLGFPICAVEFVDVN